MGSEGQGGGKGDMSGTGMRMKGRYVTKKEEIGKGIYEVVRYVEGGE